MVVDIAVPAQGGSSGSSVVGSVVGQMTNGAPSDHTDINIEEPLSGGSDQVFSFNVGDSGGNFRSGNLSVQVQDLVTEGLSDVVSGFVLEEFIV